jgi:hypothetical protein
VHVIKFDAKLQVLLDDVFDWDLTCDDDAASLLVFG